MAWITHRWPLFWMQLLLVVQFLVGDTQIYKSLCPYFGRSVMVIELKMNVFDTFGVCLSVGGGLGCGWRLDAPAHPSATILWPRVTCLNKRVCNFSRNGDFLAEGIAKQFILHTLPLNTFHNICAFMRTYSRGLAILGKALSVRQSTRCSVCPFVTHKSKSAKMHIITPAPLRPQRYYHLGH